jgi:formylglycine-generating enzyme required for sulfatase activity
VDLFEEDGYEMLMRALRARAYRIGVVAQTVSKLSEKDEQDKRLKILQRQARSLEESGNLEGALEVYLEIENNNPFIVGIEQKILELQEKNRANQRLLGLIKSTENKKRITTSKKRLSKSGVARFAGVMSILFFLFAIFAASRIPSLIKEISFTATSSNLITPTISSTLIVSETPLSTEIIDTKGVSMLLVPAGTFLMGSDEFEDSEKPSHPVDLPAYYIDKFEATNKFYKDCVDAGWCIPPVKSSSATRPSYYGNPEFDDYPVSYINWNMAKSFCDWRGARLPTEAEWEKAARGSNGRNYPWGNALNCDYANYQLSIR